MRLAVGKKLRSVRETVVTVPDLAVVPVVAPGYSLIRTRRMLKSA